MKTLIIAEPKTWGLEYVFEKEKYSLGGIIHLEKLRNLGLSDHETQWHYCQLQLHPHV